MSVICKVYITTRKPIADGKELITCNCVAENEVMAAYNPDAEDKLFSRYSPSGSAEFVLDQSSATQLPQGLGLYQDKLYLMFIQSGERPTLNKAIATASLQVRSCTDFGGTSKQFDLVANYVDRDRPLVWPQIAQFMHRIMIDNPRAAEQFKPGDKDWWVGVYDASKHSMNEVVELAHGG